MTKLIFCYITQNEEQWLSLSLNSIIKVADKVVIVDSGSKDNTKKVAESICKKNKVEFIWLTYKRNWQRGDDGGQRSVYLDYLKDNHLDDWAFILDADEVISGDLVALKNGFPKYESLGIKGFHLKTHHLIGDFGHEDTTFKVHWTKGRIYKISSALYQPQIEHGIVQGISQKEWTGLGEHIEMWHFAHARHAFYWLEKYLEMRDKSELHKPALQEWLYYNHLLGRYPRKEVNPTELPKIIQDKFFIAGDILPWQYADNKEIYRPRDSADIAFEEITKFLKENDIKPCSLLDVGAGGEYWGDCWRALGWSYLGMDIKKNDGVTVKGCMENIPFWNELFECIFCCHVFEHTSDPIKTLKEFHRILKPGGLIFMISPPDTDMEIFRMDDEHKFVFTESQIISLMNKNGLRPIKTKTCRVVKKDKTLESNLIIAAKV